MENDQEPVWAFEPARPYFRKIESVGVIHWDNLRLRFLSLVPSNARVLDLGAGKDAEDTILFSNAGLNVISADIDEQTPLITSENGGGSVSQVRMDMLHLGLAQNSVDAIWFANTIIFTGARRTSEVLLECSRSIKQGGILFICDNFFNASMQEDVFEQEPNWRSSYKIMKAVVSAGFEIIEEQIGIEIPEKAGFTTPGGLFHVIYAKKL